MSVRLRLTLWYTVVLAVTLAAFSVLAYGLMWYTLSAQVDTAVRDYAARAAAGAKASPVLPVARFQQDPFTDPDMYAQYVLPNGAVGQRSLNLGGRNLPLPAELLRSDRTESPGELRFDTVWVGGRHLRLFTVPLYADSGTFLGWLQVGAGLEPVDRALSRLRWSFGLGGLAALALAAGAGWVLARTAMRPIDRLTRAATQVAESADLSQRVETGGLNDEVGRLARTFNDMLAKLEVAYSRLAEAAATQRQFVADASHELRTPLTILRGNLDVLRRMGDAEPELRQEALADMAAEAEHMSRLVEDLMAMARADAGQRLERTRQPIEPLVAEVLRRAENLPHEGIDLWAHDMAVLRGVEVEADRDAVVRCLLILLDNAFKYTPPGGRVTVATEADAQHVLVHVADTGIGISPEDLPRIFDRFYRADRARSTKGTGLGLSIARWIAREHGGDLWVASELGKGSVFTLRLPRVG
jgi:two-component system OmpR family sensor kinase